MAISTVGLRETLAQAYGNATPWVAAYTTVPGSAAGTEPSGGSPAYARKAITWAAGSVDGQITGTVVFDIPIGSTIKGIGLHSAQTGGTYLDGITVADQSFVNSAGQLTVALTAAVS